MHPARKRFIVASVVMLAMVGATVVEAEVQSRLASANGNG